MVSHIKYTTFWHTAQSISPDSRLKNQIEESNFGKSFAALIEAYKKLLYHCEQITTKTTRAKQAWKTH
jgi:hypothetical protein